MRSGSIGTTLCLLACGPRVAADGSGDASSEETGQADTSSADVTTSESSGSVGEDEDAADDKPDFPIDDCPGCDALDVLFVIDNSAHTADLQLALGRTMPAFVARLSDAPRSVQVMFTTTDVGNPSCTPFQPAGYEPAMGGPIASSCNERIARFTGLGSNPEVRPEVCTSLCPSDVVPTDAFVAFDTGTGESNVGALDMVDDALACLLPQGINGCGYESPLEAMLQALNPGAPHNVGDRPFLRADADLAIVIATDESDCSIADYGVMEDESYFEINPDNGQASASSALCWNAGVMCTGPDADGVYTGCMSVEGPLQPVSRYADVLASLHAGGKQVTMLALVGVPADGGLDALVYRDWLATDLSAAEIQTGIDAADLQFDFGIGPACAEGDGEIRALPSPRLFDVCDSLDDGACCIESVCGDHEAAIDCLLEAAAP